MPESAMPSRQNGRDETQRSRARVRAMDELRRAAERVEAIRAEKRRLEGKERDALEGSFGLIRKARRAMELDASPETVARIAGMGFSVEDAEFWRSMS